MPDEANDGAPTEQAMTPNITDISLSEDVKQWAAELRASRTATCAIYFLDGAPIHAVKGVFGWYFHRNAA